MKSDNKIKTKLKQGESTISIADYSEIELDIIEKQQQEYVTEIKRQSIQQRITLRQSIRDQLPQAVSKAIAIMDMDFEKDMKVSGKEADFKEHISFLKVQLDAAKSIMSMATHVLGEDILTLWAEKEPTKKSGHKMVYESEVLQDGRAKLTAKLNKEVVEEAGVGQIELKIEDVM